MIEKLDIPPLPDNLSEFNRGLGTNLIELGDKINELIEVVNSLGEKRTDCRDPGCHCWKH